MCDEREQLIGYVYDECSADERGRIESHLASCPACRDEIAGLRHTREDLLAWGVPEHAPVWRPVPVAAALPWWRRSPVGLLAAAAAVVLLAGMGGAAASRVMLPRPAPPGVTAQELSDVERQIVALMRTELERIRVAADAASSRPVLVPTSGAAFERRLMGRIDAADRKTLESVNQLYQDFYKIRKGLERQTQKLQNDVDSVKLAIQQMGGGR